MSSLSGAINNLDNLQAGTFYKKKMMLIERQKHYSDFIFILALGFIISLAGLASALSPSTCLQMSSSRLLHNNIWKSPLVVTIKDISPLNAYIYADVQFLTYDYNPTIKSPINLDISIEFFLKGKSVSTLKKKISYMVYYTDYQSKATKPARLFYYNVLKFDKIIYNISYENPPSEVKYLATSTFRDEPSFSKLKFYVSSLLCFILTVVCVMYAKTFYVRFWSWRNEQKATFYLLVLSIISNFPLFLYASFVRPSILNVLLINAAKSIYDSFLYIYCLIIVYSLSGSFHIEKEKRKFVIIFLVLFFTNVFHRMNPETALGKSEIYTKNKLFSRFESFLHLCCSMYFLYRVDKALSNLDSRYTKKALIYIEIFFVFLIIGLSVKIVTDFFMFLKQGPLYYIVVSMLSSMFPITMVYFHLPLHKSANDGLLSSSDDLHSEDQVEILSIE